jgi:predicted Zn-dependent protease
MAALLGAILVGVATGADPEMISGAVGASQGMAMEAQIGFTRSNEYEADRVGVGVLADAGFNPMGMPDFFETMGRASGSLYGNSVPEFLLTHPMSSDRMAESRARARQYPLVDVNNSNGYEIARARIRMLTSSRPEIALEQFKQLQNEPDKAGRLEIEYGIAIANMQMGNYKAAEDQLTTLLEKNEEIIPLHSTLAVAQAKTGDIDKAFTTFETAMTLFPRNVPLTVRYCEVLLITGQATKAHKILLDLLNHVPPTQEQVRLIAVAANTAGDTAEASYYMAEYHAMSGSLLLAIEQLKLALNTPGLDSVDRARFSARLNEFQSYLPARNEKKDKQNGE